MRVNAHARVHTHTRARAHAREGSSALSLTLALGLVLLSHLQNLVWSQQPGASCTSLAQQSPLSEATFSLHVLFCLLGSLSLIAQ